MSDLISRTKALDVIRSLQTYKLFEGDDMILVDKADVQTELMMLPSAEKTQLSGEGTTKDATLGLIKRQDAIDAIKDADVFVFYDEATVTDDAVDITIRCTKKSVIDSINELSSAEPENEIPRRVLWSGWKGYRDTRYKCPNCEKPVRNDDVYCHRCGQKLMFPHISHTPYIEGQKQELIVRWDDEE